MNLFKSTLLVSVMTKMYFPLGKRPIKPIGKYFYDLHEKVLFIGIGFSGLEINVQLRHFLTKMLDHCIHLKRTKPFPGVNFSYPKFQIHLTVN